MFFVVAISPGKFTLQSKFPWGNLLCKVNFPGEIDFAKFLFPGEKHFVADGQNCVADCSLLNKTLWLMDKN